MLGYEAPDSDLERVLAGIWEELLGVERVGIGDNFFELGGDSIITIQVVSRARRMGYELAPRDIFLHQTIRKLSQALLGRGRGASLGEQGLLEGGCGLLPIQHWYFEQEQTNYDHFNQSVLLGIAKDIGVSELSGAVKRLLGQHDVLRFRYQRGAWRAGNRNTVRSYQPAYW